MMAIVNPSLFSALGKGFSGDVYAVDGNHLRWQFDPRLGFPRYAFCVDQRSSVTTGRNSPDNAERFADLRLAAGSSPQTVWQINVGGLHLRRNPKTMRHTDQGVTLDGGPIELQFAQRDGHACWVRLQLTLRSRGAGAVVEALYDNRGHGEVVDRASHSTGRIRPIFDDVIVVNDRLGSFRTRLAELLDRPTKEPGGPGDGMVLDPALMPLQRRLVSLDPSRFRRVSEAWLREVQANLGELRLTPDQLASDLSVPVAVTLEVSAARIDRLSVSGTRATLHDVRWVRSEELAADKRWRPVGCFPAATDEPDYVERNKDLFAGQGADATAKERIIFGGPVGAEPLDEPEVPPTRTASDDEKARRYLIPWLDRLEPWLERVLRESLGGMRHQSEVTITEALDDAGQVRGAGIPVRLSARPPQMTMRPYPILLAAAMSGFPTARLAGLGCVLTDVGEGAVDYRVRGTWLVEDLWAWVGAESRRLAELTEKAVKASPADFVRLHADVLAAQFTLIETTQFVSDLVATEVNGVVELVALVLGIRPDSHPLFAAPTSVTVTADGLGLPPDHAHQAVAAVEWALRQRARVVDDTAVPTGACIARAPGASAGRFDSVRNSNDPADSNSLPVAILPAGPVGSPGLAGTARFGDRYADDGIDYRYGVSECDPFGRWSPFVEVPFRWDDMTPPAPPLQVQAFLDEGGTPTRQTLTMTFSWPALAGPAAATSFELHLHRHAPPSATPTDPAQWGSFRARRRNSGCTADGARGIYRRAQSRRDGDRRFIHRRVASRAIGAAVIPRLHRCRRRPGGAV